MTLEALKLALREFAAERDWEQFHTPKNLAMALAGETGELLEIFQWLTPEQSQSLSEKEKALARQELADVFIYLVRLADKLNIDLEQAATEKIQINAEKYPPILARGNATKYNRRKQ